MAGSSTSPPSSGSSGYVVTEIESPSLDTSTHVAIGSVHAAVRRRGAEAGAGRRGGAERGEGGRGGGRVREGPGCRRGGARVARRRDGGVHGVQGGAERLLACPGAAAPRAARQLRAPRLRPDRHDRQLRPGPARGRRRPGGRRGAAPRRRLLPGRQAGPLRVTHSGSIGTGCW
uniref:Uncharacterized protein n=1 Tax=Setaria viridis TaxID=4556 RepID=A0A4U6SQG0_SETVI|nr:hypothetical protein SEVIR_9G041750v2 [Setaria viridis]